MNELAAIKKSKINSLADKFCKVRLNEEYYALCEKVILKLSRKKNIPFLTGKEEIWASAIIWCIARVNFLFDKSNDYYLTGDDICNFFGTSKSTVSQKASLIDKTLKIKIFDEEFCTQEIVEQNPLRNFVSIDGFIVPIDLLDDTR